MMIDKSDMIHNCVVVALRHMFGQDAIDFDQNELKVIIHHEGRKYIYRMVLI